MSIGATVVGSMQPFSAYVMPGFPNVQSTIGVQTMSQVPRFNAQMRGELASQALGEIAAKKRQEQLIEAREKEYEQTARSRRIEGLAGMAGSLLGFDDSEQVASVDPTDLMERLYQMMDRNRQRRQVAMTRPTVYASGVLGQANVSD